MFMMNYLFGLVLLFMILGVVVLGVTQVPYRGVIALMGVSFCCCMLMVVMGRMFAALVMYIVYLGGLVVVFGYCVSVEKEGDDIFKIDWFKYLMFLLVGLVIYLWLMFSGGFGGLLDYMNWEELFCLEVNGGAVFYYGGGIGLLICSWGLMLVLFSALVILSWSRLGSLRPF